MLKEKKLKLKNAGYSVLELVFYVSFFALLALVVIDSMIIMTKSFRETVHFSAMSQSGTIAERMGRAIRQAYSINTISASSLRLDTLDDAGVAKTEEFTLLGSDLQLYENGVLSGNLNSPDILVSNLAFTRITTTRGNAVKVFFTVRSSNDSLSRSYDFYDTIVLRGNY